MVMDSAMPTNQSVEEQVFRFVSDFASEPASGLHLGTRIANDLGIDGDDADEFFAKFSTKFQVDMAGFVFSEFFQTEAGFNPFAYLWHRLRGSPQLSQKDVTIGELIASAAVGKWRLS